MAIWPLLEGVANRALARVPLRFLLGLLSLSLLGRFCLLTCFSLIQLLSNSWPDVFAGILRHAHLFGAISTSHTTSLAIRIVPFLRRPFLGATSSKGGSTSVSMAYADEATQTVDQRLGRRQSQSHLPPMNVDHWAAASFCAFT